MRVATLSYKDGNGGAAIAAMRLAKSLNRYTDINNSFLCVQKTSEKPFVHQIGSKNKFYWDRLLYFPYEKSKEDRYKFSPSFSGSDVTKSELVQSADIIHLHWINHGFMSIENIGQLAELKVPIVWTLHDMWAFTGGCHYSEGCHNFQLECGNCKFLRKSSNHDLSNRLWEKKKEAYSNLDISFVTCSRWLKDEALSSALLGDRSVVNIQNPVDGDIYKNIERGEARQKLKLEPKGKYILFVAAKVTDLRKGIDLLLESLSKLHIQNCKLLVVGAIPDVSLLEKIDIPYVSLGSLNESSMVLAYNAADVFVIPSRQDNLPNTVLESLCCGTPVVGFNIGGVGEMVMHMSNGFLVNPFDINELCGGIEWVLETELDRERIREDVLKTNSAEVIASQYLNVYQSLAQ